jgi:hypothetical protein
LRGGGEVRRPRRGAWRRRTELKNQDKGRSHLVVLAPADGRGANGLRSKMVSLRRAPTETMASGTPAALSM